MIVRGMTNMIALEEVVMVGLEIVHMGCHQVLLFVGDQVLIMAELASQFMISTMGQCMTGKEIQIVGGTIVLVKCMISEEVLIMGRIGVLSMVDTTADLQLEGQELENYTFWGSVLTNHVIFLAVRGTSSSRQSYVELAFSQFEVAFTDVYVCLVIGFLDCRKLVKEPIYILFDQWKSQCIC